MPWLKSLSYALVHDRLVERLKGARHGTCHLYINAAGESQKGMAANDKAIMGDIPNYTDIAPQIQISEVVVA